MLIVFCAFAVELEMEAKQKIASFKRLAFSKLKSNSYEVPSPTNTENQNNGIDNSFSTNKNNSNHKKKVLIKDINHNSTMNDKSKFHDGTMPLSPTGWISWMFIF